MTTKDEATSGARLCAIYEHRTTNSEQVPPDRYFYSRERVINDKEYQGMTRPAFFGATAKHGEPIGVPEAVCWAFGDYLLGGELPNGQTLESWLGRTAQMMNKALPVPKDMGYGTWVSDPTRELKEDCGKFTHEYYGPIEIKLDEGNEPGNSRRLKLVVGPDRREVSLNMWDGDTFVYQTFGENAVGLSAVEFDMTTPGKARVGVKNLSFSDTNPDYSETDPEPKEFAWFTPEAGS
jgi:hypothetical protein